MLHGVLTLLSRALKADARFRRAHAFRVGSTGIIFLFLIVAHATSGGVGSPGLRFFSLISWLNLTLIALAGSSFFATAITEEKEEGTLGLLQLAGVSTLGLLLGKSTSRLIAALMVFVAQLPFALLAVSLGGVTVSQIIAVDIALAAFMMMIANLALLASVVAQRSGLASAMMILVLLWFLPGVHFGEHVITTLVESRYLAQDSFPVVLAGTVFDFLKDISVVTRVTELLDFETEASLLSLQVTLHVGVAMSAFAIAWMVFERVTRYADVAGPARGLVPKASSRFALFTERPWKKAVIWKDYHFLSGGHTLAVGKLVAYPVILWFLFVNESMLQRVTGIPFAQLSRQMMFAALACETCILAARLFHEELKWGTLPNLLMLPQSLPRLALGKVCGCLLGLLPGFVVLCGLHVFLWHEVAAFHVGAGGDDWSSQSNDFALFLQTFVLGDLTNPQIWIVLMQFLVLLHLTVLCSLIVPWGGLAVAVAIQLVLNSLLLGPMSVVISGLTSSYRAEEVAIAPIIYVGLLVSTILQFMIGAQIRRLATQ